MEARTAAVDLSHRGLIALGTPSDDATALMHREAVRLGLCTPEGQPLAGRCAELVIVCDVLASVPPRAQAPSPSPHLVFTAPREVAAKVETRRLDVLVADIIRMATSEVRVGGPFWNDAGLEALLEVLIPAVELRGVRCTFYVHSPQEGSYLARVRGWMQALSDEHDAKVLWYAGPQGSLMHAKFVTADGARGYLGSANFTGLGFDQHVEMGVELTPTQTSELLRFLDALDQAGLFADAPPRRP